MKKTLPLLLFFALFLHQIKAQDKNDLAPCGTRDGKVAWLQSYQKNLEGYPKSDDTLYVPVTIHLVGTNDGNGYFTPNSVLDAFCTLNNDFAPSGIQFYIEGDFNYIANTTYHDHTFQQGAQMMQQYKVPNTINCYIVGSPAGNCGYSSYNLGIALSKGCTGPNDHTWAHEIGHFLSLPHPFWGWEGYTHDYAEPAPVQIDNAIVERVDSLNCGIAGDGFCDTRPDYLNYRWTCNGQGESNELQHDPDSVAFRSDGTLFMSYSNDQCMYRFSEEQTAAMRANLLTEKASYLYNQTPEGIVDQAPVQIAPAPEEVTTYYQSVLFEWEPAPNASHYLLEISPFPTFPFVQFRYIVEGTSHVSTDLSMNKKYYWRLRPYNSRSTCHPYTAVASFETGTLSTVQPVGGIAVLSVDPNPVRPAAQLRISVAVTKPLQLGGQLTSTTGQVMQSFEWEVSQNTESMMLETGNLRPGVYLLQLRSGQGVATRKIVVAH